MAFTVYQAEIFDNTPEHLDGLLGGIPDFAAVTGYDDPFIDITDTEGDHHIILLDGFCGVGKCRNETVVFDACSVNDPLALKRKRAHFR